jgi:hypothetical protein
MLSAAQRSAFESEGSVQLPGLIPHAQIDAMRACLWSHLARAHGVREHEPASWTTSRPSRFQELARSGAFAGMHSPALRAALDEVFGAGAWREPVHWGQPLVSFPTQGVAWDVPRQQWHLDASAPPSRRLPAVRVFAFLTSVRPQGGGTLAVTGSHRVVQALALRAGRALRSAEARQQLAACDPWLAALEADDVPERARRFMHEGRVVEGVPLRVVELCGEPGDVVLMRTDTLHAPAPHTLPAPRLVVAQFIDPIHA